MAIRRFLIDTVYPIPLLVIVGTAEAQTMMTFQGLPPLLEKLAGTVDNLTFASIPGADHAYTHQLRIGMARSPTGTLGAPVTPVCDLLPTSDATATVAADKGFSEAGFLPEVRAQFQETAGIRAEVLNPTRLLAILRHPDIQVVQVCAQVFNDWEAEFVSYDPKLSWLLHFMWNLDRLQDPYGYGSMLHIDIRQEKGVSQFDI